MSNIQEAIKHIELSGLKIEKIREQEYGISITKKIAASVCDVADDAICDAIIKAAKESGIADLYLIDRQFILSALRAEAEREKGCEYCNDKEKMFAVVQFVKTDSGKVQIKDLKAIDPILCPMCGRKLEGEK